jgi:uncharacterized protein (TIGR03435 family)
MLISGSAASVMQVSTRERAMRDFPRVAVALLTVCLSACIAHASAGTNSPQVGEAPPPLALSGVVQGPSIGEITWQKLKGKVVVLEFWNTRCGPCIRAIPHLNELVDEFSSKSVVFLGISDDNKDSLNAFLKRKPIKGWLALDQAFNPTRTTFDVIGIPHTVIIDATGKIAAITHPTKLNALHLHEILEGKRSTLPKFEPDLLDAGQDTVAVAISPPKLVQVSIQGPFPQPVGAFNSRSWEKPDYRFNAQKAFLRDALSAFFDISPGLIIEKGKLPDGFYDISAAAPPDKMPELKAQFEKTLRTNLGIVVLTKTQEVEVYAMTVCASNAPGLKATSKRGGGGGRPGGFYLNGTDLKGIASYLEDALNKPVIDETGLTGLWDVDIKWEMSKSELHHDSADPAKVIKAAREQLGLELKRVNRKLRVLVLERRPLQ